MHARGPRWKETLLATAALVLLVSCAPLRAVVSTTEGLMGKLSPTPLERLVHPGVEGVCTAASINWIVPVIDGVVLVDAGFDETGEVLSRALRGRRVLAVLLTHAHPDHRAAAHLFNAPVYVGKDDVPLLEGRYRYAGVMADLGRAIGVAPLPRTVIPVLDGQVFVIGGRTFTAVALPGHTPGSTGWVTDTLLFGGDAILSPTGDGIYPAPDGVTEDMRLAYQSMRKLERLPVTTLLDAHFGTLDRPKRFLQAALARAADDDTLYDHPSPRPVGCGEP
ncbi:MAG: MBL fold metallo-hydrolase [Deltaproteobacteria bacterium]|nr:MBL fold metallo-hydrolase [Deltaproteobacteria bacterium]